MIILKLKKNLYFARYEIAYYHGPGMAVIEVDVPSGFVADLEGDLTDLSYSKKSEIRNSKTVVLYYDEVIYFCFVFTFLSELITFLHPKFTMAFRGDFFSAK